MKGSCERRVRAAGAQEASATAAAVSRGVFGADAPAGL